MQVERSERAKVKQREVERRRGRTSKRRVREGEMTRVRQVSEVLRGKESRSKRTRGKREGRVSKGDGKSEREKRRRG